jgi:hypothetical protein
VPPPPARTQLVSSNQLRLVLQGGGKQGGEGGCMVGKLTPTTSCPAACSAGSWLHPEWWMTGGLRACGGGGGAQVHQ